MRSPQEIWGVVLDELQIQVSKPNYETWLKDTEGIDFDDDRFLVSAPNAFVAEWLKNRFSSLIKNTLSNVIGKIVEVQFLVQAAMQTNPQPSQAGHYDGGISIKTTKPFYHNTLNSKFTFDNFIAGKCNELAYTASKEVVMEPGQIHNPLFIYSDTGLGKTHLLQAIGNSVKNRTRRIIYTNAELITHEFVTALKSNKIDNFNEKYRNIDMLLLDDFQFFGGKKGTQQCFFHLFNDLQENDRQIVITCDSAPMDMKDIGEKLKSRLEGGLVADIKPPDYETRLAILEDKAIKYKVSVPKEVLEFIATHLHSNIRELEGGLNRIITYARLSSLPIDIELASKTLVSLMGNADVTNKESFSSINDVIEKVASYYELTPDSLTGKGRDRKTTSARQIAMYLMREYHHCRLNEIGRLFGNRDHTTVLYSCEKVSTAIAVDKQLNQCLQTILNSLKIHRNS